jgi:hypothetical protein
MPTKVGRDIGSISSQILSKIPHLFSLTYDGGGAGSDSISRAHHLSFGDVDDRFGKSVRRFLRQIVSNAARDGPVLISA